MMTKMNDRRGNPSDPLEEQERIRKALANVESWQKRWGSELSGGVSMQYGSGKRYEVEIGNPELARSIASRPIQQKASPPKIEVSKAPEIVPWPWKLLTWIWKGFRP